MKNISGSKLLQVSFLLLSLLFIPKSLQAEALKDFEVSGFIKSLNIYMESSPLSTYSSGIAAYNQQRLDASGRFGGYISFEVSAENRLTTSRTVLSNSGTVMRSSTSRYLDMERVLHNGNHSLDTLYVDRANVTFKTRSTKVTAGRQAIGFGRITLLSPLDVISPFSPEAIDTEVRPGVDAVQAAGYFGLGGEIGAAVVFGDTNEHNSYIAAFSQNWSGMDILAMAGSLQKRNMAGLGLAGNIKGLGLKAEAAVYNGKNVSTPEGDLHSSFTVGAVEAWYRFENGINIISEYYYNGAGTGNSGDYTNVMSSAFTEDGLNYLAGKHYLILEPSYELHPLVTLECLAIRNLDDSSMLIRPLIDISMSDNLVLQVFWSFYTGDKPNLMYPAYVIKSEFGSSGDYGGISMKYYF